MTSADLLDPDLHRAGDPHAVWTELRRREPVSWRAGKVSAGFWALTKHEDIALVSRDPHTFSSARGTWPEDATDAPGAAPLSPDAFMGGSLEVLDPPEHLRRRKLAQPSFAPRALADLAPRWSALVEREIDACLSVGAHDFARGAALTIATTVLAIVMGIPPADVRALRDHANVIDNPDEPTYGGGGAKARRIAAAGLYDYFTNVDARLEDPGALLGQLRTSVRDGQMSEKAFIDVASLFIIAGQETLHNALSGALLALSEHPQELGRLRDGASAATAAEEVLRWTSPITHFARFVVRDTELRGRPLRAGQRVVMFYPSANRDEDVFAEPFRFDVTRAPNPHLAFGIGEHFCVGAGLARLVLAKALEVVAGRVERVELAGPVVRLRSHFNAGPLSLPLRLVPR